MRITMTSDGRQVHIQLKGKSRKKLRAAERTALRLLAEMPVRDEQQKKIIGFTA
ncbi:hypothetical protein ACIQCR_24655 [Streptomyces sp. NPDC093249]|uniref:hypothetical protein n=1 Tax=unclassified Streptomyces TaxID=2593676 RepID=UPI0038249FFC